MAEDPYKVLGVARDASTADIRRAYHKRAKRDHPDHNQGDKQAEERFKAASVAHDLLSDVDRRARYDRGEIEGDGQEKPPPRRRSPAAPGTPFGATGPAGWSMDDIEAMFGAREAGQRGRDEQYRLGVAFLDAVLGTTTRLALPDGRSIDVRVPPGVEEGQTLRLRGQGGAGLGTGPAGDALIELSVMPHPFFRRTGQDIRLDLPITLSEAVLGGRVTVPTPGGPVEMAVPAGSDTGREMRLRGRGVPAATGRLAGDLYVVLQVTLGPPDAALQAFLREWRPDPPFDPRAALSDPG